MCIGTDYPIVILSETETFAVEVITRNHKHKYRKNGWRMIYRHNEIGDITEMICNCGKKFDITDYGLW